MQCRLPKWLLPATPLPRPKSPLGAIMAALTRCSTAPKAVGISGSTGNWGARKVCAAMMGALAASSFRRVSHLWSCVVVLEFHAPSHGHGLLQRKVWDSGSPSPPGLTIQDNALLCATVPVRLHERAPILCTFTFQRSQLLCAWKQQLIHGRLLRNVLPRTLAVLHFTSVASHLGTETSPSTILETGTWWPCFWGMTHSRFWVANLTMQALETALGFLGRTAPKCFTI